MAHTEFDHDQFDEAYPPGIERSWWHVARNRTIVRVLKSHVPRNASILEIGCGTGIVTRQLREAGWNAKGVELGAPKNGLHVPEHLFLSTDAFALPENVRTGIDTLVLFDVIEHIEDAPAFLRALLGAFPNAQRVAVTVPARKELWTTFDDHFGHFRRYTRPMLRAEFSAAGLATEHVSYFFHALHPAIALNNLLRGRERNIRFHAPALGSASTINGMVGRLFAWESQLLPGALPGSSIIAVGRRA
ncbi:MAG TPA: class I SAM-dependent methyltransferase [Flavobacteriales bacterium]|nr:class I SAM-dependent methyltransferase [Flavobacteriales bacterium]